MATESFGRLFRNSRLASLPAAIESPAKTATYPYVYNKFSGRSALPPVTGFPTQQVITTNKACHRRGDWGLKRNLPTTLRSQTIAIEKMDTLEHQTVFDVRDADAKFLQRWQDMAIPLNAPDPSTSSSYTSSSFSATAVHRSPFEHETRATDDGRWVTNMPRKTFNQYLAKAKKRRGEYLRDQDQMKDGSRESSKLTPPERALKFLGMPIDKPGRQIHGSAGLSYTLPGSLSSTPSGTSADPNVLYKSIPGRNVAVTFDDMVPIAIGGFIARDSSTMSRSGYIGHVIRRETVDRYIPRSAHITDNGSIQLDVRRAIMLDPGNTRSLGYADRISFGPQQRRLDGPIRHDNLFPNMAEIQAQAVKTIDRLALGNMDTPIKKLSDRFNAESCDVKPK